MLADDNIATLWSQSMHSGKGTDYQRGHHPLKSCFTQNWDTSYKDNDWLHTFHFDLKITFSAFCFLQMNHRFMVCTLARVIQSGVLGSPCYSDSHEPLLVGNSTVKCVSREHASLRESHICMCILLVSKPLQCWVSISLEAAKSANETKILFSSVLWLFCFCSRGVSQDTLMQSWFLNWRVFLL